MAARCGVIVRIGLGLALGAVLATPLADAEARDPAFPRIFGAEAIYRRDTATLVEWTDMVRRFEAARRRPERVPALWWALVGELRGLPLAGKIARVNDVINRSPYVPTRLNGNRKGYWETPFEFLERGGQCQDFAATKFLLLRAAGVPDALMRIVVVYDTALRKGHAVLIVNLDGAPVVLDNLAPLPLSAAAIGTYEPLYAINESGWWLLLRASRPGA